MTIMSNRPRKAKVITPHQQEIKSRFLLAVEYAKRQIADPVLKAKYEPDPAANLLVRMSRLLQIILEEQSRMRMNRMIRKPKIMRTAWNPQFV
jgi:hypothetical protein